MFYRSLAVSLLGLAACACGRAPETANSGPPGEPRAAGVIVHEITLEREAERIEAVGTARARASATIFAEADGEVQRVNFTAGDAVETGDVLLALEAEEERLDVRLAEVAVREAEQLLARYRRIEDTGAVSDSQIDEAQTALDAARIQLDQARVALARREVRAPFAGHVGLTDIDPGARITAATEITQLDDRSVLFVDFDPPEQVFGRLNVGDTVEAKPFAGPDRSYPARIVNVDSRINPTRRTFTVRAELDNAADVLRPGMSFRVSLDLLGEPWPAVPEAAISWGSDGAYVWIVRDGRAAEEPVTLIERRQGRVLVSGAFGAGDLVIAEGVQKVREGSPVEILETRRADRGVNEGATAGAGSAGSAFGE
jgi:RND family efflux transporter MFP subunit